MATSLKWTEQALAAYQKCGDQLKKSGYRALRDLPDRDCNSQITFWAHASGMVVIQQTFLDTGDVYIYKSVLLESILLEDVERIEKLEGGRQ